MGQNNTIKILCFVADYNEVSPLILNHPSIKKDSNLFHIILDNVSVSVFITGWGSINVLNNIKRYPLSFYLEYDHIFNIGFAGSCSYDLPLDRCYTINTIFSEDALLKPKSINPLPQLPQTSLHTFHSPYRKGLSKVINLVDMEGYMIASLTERMQKPCSYIKIVSDYTEPSGKNYIKLNKHKLANILVKNFLSSINYLDCNSF